MTPAPNESETSDHSRSSVSLSLVQREFMTIERQDHTLDDFIDFTILFEAEEHVLNFEILKGIGHDGKTRAPLYQIQGWEDSSDATSDVSSAERFLKGELKWDGCMNVSFVGECIPHFCGLQDALIVERIFRALYVLGFERLKNWDADLAS
jgi:hypothetical protein